MAFDIRDPQSISMAQETGLSKAQEIAETLRRLASAGVITLINATAPAPGEDATDIDPNITNERHDLYKRLVEQYQREGTDAVTAKNAAIDYAFRSLGAEESPSLRAAHQQITEKYIDSIGAGKQLTQAETFDLSNLERFEIHNQYRDLDVSVSEADSLTNSHSLTRSNAERVATGESGEVLRSRKQAQARVQAKNSRKIIDEVPSSRQDAAGLPFNESERPPTNEEGNKGLSANIQTGYSSHLQEAGATQKYAKAAAIDLENGKGEHLSESVRETHRQILAHQYLRALYARIYVDLKEVPNQVAQAAALDAARGLGAKSSWYIREVHQLASGKHSTGQRASQAAKPQVDKPKTIRQHHEKQGAAPSETDEANASNWSKYSQQFIERKAEKYPGEKQLSAFVLMRGAAIEAFKSGLSRTEVESMLESSPMNKPSGDNQVMYAKGITKSALNTIARERQRTANSRSRARSQKNGVELSIS